VSDVIRKPQPLLFRARSYMAFVLAPQSPIADWLADFDASIECSKGIFAHHPVALDMSTVTLNPDEIAHLIANLSERSIRVLGIEGISPNGAEEGLPPILRDGRDGQTFQLPDQAIVVNSVVAQKQEKKMASLLIEEPVRSGQSIVHIKGDVTVLGSVGSGAEIIAGGSIHIYGTLRGRAMAGVTGDNRARIFCHRIEAELLAIDSHYKMADDFAADLRSQPTQAWLEGKTLRISAIN
jgi:septum site-determining protein MinC